MSWDSASLIELEGVLPHSRYDEQDVPDIPSDWLNNEATETSLCKRCQAFDIQAFARIANRKRGYLLRDVESAAAEGCEFCILLLDSVKDVAKPTYFYRSFSGRDNAINPDVYVHMTLSENYAKGTNALENQTLRANRLLIQVGDRFSDVQNASGHELCLAADPASPAATSGDITGRYLTRDPSSDEHYETIQDWIKACSAHPKCNQTVSGSERIDAHNSPLPARVIEVTKKNKSLYLRNTEGTNGAYITLTHRWNLETEKCKTTTENYTERLEGRGFGQLPKLFQDVLTVAARLGIRYVWIDSICIIQKGDDGADWRREAPKMAQYYQFSLFTIAGTMQNMENGILYPYPDDFTPWASKLVRLPYRDKTHTKASHFYIYKREVPLVDEYWSSVRESILFRRGWILQEWLLSKRLVWYTSQGLFFECQQDTPRTDAQEMVQLARAKSDLQSHLFLKSSFHVSSASILSFWYHALEVYSGCHLTKPKVDRILAITGIAKEVGRILANPRQEVGREREEQNEVFSSGLWLRDIHHGLLWEEDHASQPWATGIDEAPSWSWASLITQVKWPQRGQDVQEAMEVLGICLRKQPEHERPNHLVVNKRALPPSSNAGIDGTISGPQQTLFDPTNMSSDLHIRGKLCTVHVRGYLETKENLHAAAISTSYSPIPTSCNWRAICSPTRPEIIAGWGSLEQLRTSDGGCDDFGIAVHALHVATRCVKSGFLIKRSDPVLDVLFLERVGEDGNVYKRLGVGRIMDAHLMKEFNQTKEQDIQLV